MNSIHRLLAVASCAALGCAVAARAAEIPSDPILRIETGRHTAITHQIATDAGARWLRDRVARQDAVDLEPAVRGVAADAASADRHRRRGQAEDPAWGNGAFTKAVVEGIGGKADFQKTGKITHKGLDYYVAERVKQLTNGKQSPVSIAPNGVADFPIAVAGAP